MALTVCCAPHGTHCMLHMALTVCCAPHGTHCMLCVISRGGRGSSARPTRSIRVSNVKMAWVKAAGCCPCCPCCCCCFSSSGASSCSAQGGEAAWCGWVSACLQGQRDQSEAHRLINQALPQPRECASRGPARPAFEHLQGAEGMSHNSAAPFAVHSPPHTLHLTPRISLSNTSHFAPYASRLTWQHLTRNLTPRISQPHLCLTPRNPHSTPCTAHRTPHTSPQPRTCAGAPSQVYWGPSIGS